MDIVGCAGLADVVSESTLGLTLADEQVPAAIGVNEFGVLRSEMLSEDDVITLSEEPAAALAE